MTASFCRFYKVGMYKGTDGTWSGEDDEVLVPVGIILIEHRETILLILYPWQKLISLHLPEMVRCGSTCKQGEITLLIVDTTPPISHHEKVLAMIRNFHVQYVAVEISKPHFLGPWGPFRLSLFISGESECSFEKKNSKVQVKAYTFEIPMKNVGTIWRGW